MLSPQALFCPACGTAKSRNFDGDPLLGQRVGERFLIIDRIGHGASGTIYRAEHVTLRRKVAVKVLHHELSRDDLAMERFRREATTVSDIENEHIVQIHDFGRIEDGRLYLAMELLDGETLDNVLKREHRLPVQQAVDILIQLGEALMEAHAMGYVHRDLRPRNIYLAVRRGRANFVKLLDFGLAKLVEKEGDAASTSLGMTFGEPKYMSPEQARGEPVDRRADIYSLGCIAYEMLTGQPLFAGGKVFEILTRHVDTMPTPPSERRPEVPAWLDTAIMRMLAKRPDDRFITVYRLIEALRTGLQTGETMSGEVARRRETNPPPSVSMAMAKLGKTTVAGRPGADAVPETVPDDATERTSDRIERRLRGEVSEPTGAPLRLDDSPPHQQALDPDDLRKTSRLDPDDLPRPARGKRESSSGKRSDSSSSSNISAAWYADGEHFDGDADVEPTAQAKLDRARAVISPSQTFDDQYYPPGNRTPVVVATLAGGVLLIALLAYFWPRSSGSASQSISAALPPDAAPAIAVTVDASVAATTLPDAAKIVSKPTPKPDRTPPVRPPPDRRPPDRTPPDPPDRDPDPPTNTSSQDKEQADFFAKLGQTSLRSGDILGAASQFNKAIKLDAGNVTAIAGLGEIALSQGSYAAAIGHLKRATARNKNNSRLWTLLGEAYLGSDQNTNAADAFKKALKVNPDNERARAGYNEA
ncbi:MAG TPA: protein kinase, partial [Kofleriaceae bacterium]|nr:protein kinase [Kofleriaceae bacterium]